MDHSSNLTIEHIKEVLRTDGHRSVVPGMLYYQKAYWCHLFKIEFGSNSANIMTLVLRDLIISKTIATVVFVVEDLKIKNVEEFERVMTQKIFGGDPTFCQLIDLAYDWMINICCKDEVMSYIMTTGIEVSQADLFIDPQGITTRIIKIHFNDDHFNRKE